MRKIKFLLFIGLLANTYFLSAQNTERILSDDDVIQIGKKHNAFLEEVFKNFNYEAENYEIELKSRFETVMAANEGLEPYRTMIFDHNCDIECLNEKLNNSYASEVFNFINNLKLNEINSLEELTETLNEMQTQARNTIEDGITLDAVLVATEVCKNSAEFWLPVSQGGNGIGDDVISAKKIGKGTRVAAADGLGASGSLIGGALIAGIAGGPIGVGAFFGAVAFSAAWSSGTAALLP